MQNGEVKELLMAEYGMRYCENCHYPKDGDPIDCHHCLVGDRKKWHDILTNPINCCLICRTCHQNGIVNGFEFRVRFLRKQADKYGANAMWKWWSSLPEKLRMTNGWIENELFNNYYIEELK
jgi:hypothetical protein